MKRTPNTTVKTVITTQVRNLIIICIYNKKDKTNIKRKKLTNTALKQVVFFFKQTDGVINRFDGVKPPTSPQKVRFKTDSVNK